jgi:hypothetical protein
MIVLSPFSMCVISEYFKPQGYIPVDRDLLHMYANHDDIYGTLAFINLAVILSYPEANLGFTSLISLRYVGLNAIFWS